MPVFDLSNAALQLLHLGNHHSPTLFVDHPFGWQVGLFGPHGVDQNEIFHVLVS